MRVVDDAVLDLLRAAIPPIDADGNGTLEDRVHDGFVPTADPDSKVVTAALPYVVYYSNFGDDHNPRLDGRSGRRSVFFQVSYVGASRDQAKWAGERQRAALTGTRPSIPGLRTWLINVEESQRVRRDDDAARPDGSPLFYGVDTYAVSVVLTAALR